MNTLAPLWPVGQSGLLSSFPLASNIPTLGFAARRALVLFFSTVQLPKPKPPKSGSSQTQPNHPVLPMLYCLHFFPATVPTIAH